MTWLSVKASPFFFDSPFNKYTLLNFCKILSHIIYKVFLFKPNKCIEGIQFINPGIQIVQNCHFKPFLSGEVWRLAFQQRLGPQWIWYETTRIMLLNNLSYTLNRENNLRQVRATLESSSNRESFDRISGLQESWNFKNSRTPNNWENLSKTLYLHYSYQSNIESPVSNFYNSKTPDNWRYCQNSLYSSLTL